MSNRVFVNLQQCLVIGFGGVQLLEVVPGGMTHGGKLPRMTPRPLDFARQVNCVTCNKVQTVVAVLDDFLDAFPTVRREQAVATLELAGEALLRAARPSG